MFIIVSFPFTGFNSHQKNNSPKYKKYYGSVTIYKKKKFKIGSKYFSEKPVKSNQLENNNDRYFRLLYATMSCEISILIYYQKIPLKQYRNLNKLICLLTLLFFLLDDNIAYTFICYSPQNSRNRIKIYVQDLQAGSRNILKRNLY